MKGTIRQFGLPGFELGDYIREAVDFLRAHEPTDGYFMGFSGGKDSITSLELCRIAGVKHLAFYTCTRIDPPEMYRFIKQYYPTVTWLYPQKTIWAMIQKKSPPLRIQRWCCVEIKEKPSWGIPLLSRVFGIRAEESEDRKSRGRINVRVIRKGRGKERNGQLIHTHYHPIFHWEEWAVWEFIEARKLPYPPLYDEEFHRVGCVVCPYIMDKSPGAILQREISQRRWPGIWKTYEIIVKRWWYKKRQKSYPGETADDYWQAYLNGFESTTKSSAHETGQSQILRLHKCQN